MVVDSFPTVKVFDCGPNFYTPTEYDGENEFDDVLKDVKVRKTCKKPVPHVVALTQANYDSYLKEVKDSGKSIYVE